MTALGGLAVGQDYWSDGRVARRRVFAGEAIFGERALLRGRERDAPAARAANGRALILSGYYAAH